MCFIVSEYESIGRGRFKPYHKRNKRSRGVFWEAWTAPANSFCITGSSSTCKWGKYECKHPWPATLMCHLFSFLLSLICQVTRFQELLSKLTQNCPRISKMRLHFDWSDLSVSLLTQFQQLRVLELKYFWVFKCVTPSTLQMLIKSLPNLKSLTLNILVPLRNLGISYTLESQSLEFLDVSPSRGLVFSCLKLPALRELRAKKIVLRVTLDRRTRTRIQSRWPCLYHVLREGTPRLQALNNERLLPTWREKSYGELTAILEQSCYCVQHLDSWLW